jgi:hypothetical protein
MCISSKESSTFRPEVLVTFTRDIAANIKQYVTVNWPWYKMCIQNPNPENSKSG